MLHVAGLEPGTPKLAPTLLYALRPNHLRYAASVKMLHICCASITPHSCTLSKREPKFRALCQTHATPVPDLCQTMPDPCRTCARQVSDPCQTHAGPVTDCAKPVLDLCRTSAVPMLDLCLTSAVPMPDLCWNRDRPMPEPCRSRAGPMLSCFLPIFSRLP